MFPRSKLTLLGVLIAVILSGYSNLVIASSDDPAEISKLISDFNAFDQVTIRQFFRTVADRKVLSSQVVDKLRTLKKDTHWSLLRFANGPDNKARFEPRLQYYVPPCILGGVVAGACIAWTKPMYFVPSIIAFGGLGAWIGSLTSQAIHDLPAADRALRKRFMDELAQISKQSEYDSRAAATPDVPAAIPARQNAQQGDTDPSFRELESKPEPGR